MTSHSSTLSEQICDVQQTGGSPLENEKITAGNVETNSSYLKQNSLSLVASV